MTKTSKKRTRAQSDAPASRAALSPSTAVPAIRIGAVTKQSWKDFVRLFEAKGGPHFCWCMSYREPAARDWSKAEKKKHMAARIENATPVGVLAYDGDAPVGFCSVAPRETYLRLSKSRTMPRATLVETPTWAVLCFFIPRSHRRRRIGHALLEGAVAYAREQGAKVVEGYPFDSAGVSSTHRGHSRLFAAAHFMQDGCRWWRDAQFPFDGTKR
jgi:GNAT superfamily N-acetyltransferase